MKKIKELMKNKRTNYEEIINDLVDEIEGLVEDDVKEFDYL